MKCPKCGATVLKGDQICKKCGAQLNEAANAYKPEEQVRSRFTLVYRAWIGAWRGKHLEWLGYTEQAQEVKAKYNIGIGQVIGLHFAHLFVSIMYQTIECLAVIFGKYRTDAEGHPVRYLANK